MHYLESNVDFSFRTINVEESHFSPFFPKQKELFLELLFFLITYLVEEE